jgi:hypothetical protein
MDQGGQSLGSGFLIALVARQFGLFSDLLFNDRRDNCGYGLTFDGRAPTVASF